MSTKPWEEKWCSSLGIVRVRAQGTGEDRARVAQASTEPYERIIVAAPDMARALLGLLETAKHGVLTEEKCDAARVALAKAGVPLP